MRDASSSGTDIHASMCSPAESYSAAPIMIGLASLAALTAGWHQTPELSHGPLAPRQQVEVWQGGELLRWHAVVVSRDSISGVSFLEPIECDSCRIALPRSAVDSVRLGNPTAGFLKSVGLGLGILVGSAMIICAVEECPGERYD
jgi:hypothetical protein